MLNKFKYTLFGSPLPTQILHDVRLTKFQALAAFSPDALASIAYANQEIFLALVIAGSAGLQLSFPISVTISIFLSIVAISYYQTIESYPSGGGSYTVAKDNLGTTAGLISAASLLLDYLLNSAVSLTAGVAALTSAFPNLYQYRIIIALLILFIISIINLRGIQDSSSLMAFPVYFYVLSFLFMIVYGLFQSTTAGNHQLNLPVDHPKSILTPFIVLHAFSVGCTALTGIEAISNGVPAFKKPEPKNAQKTLIIMTIIMATLFMGSIWLTQSLNVAPGNEETIISALARRIFQNNPGYYIIQFSTLLILIIATNTSYNGFPRLAAILAKDGYLPRQLFNLGDRLVYTNGIILLSISSALLIIFFNGDTHQLIPLFAIGAFLAFTLSQFGMVVHWRKMKGEFWPIKAAINGLGTSITLLILILITANKFIHGAWLSVILIPIQVILFSLIHNHYQSISKSLTIIDAQPKMKKRKNIRIVIPISGIHKGIFEPINFARSISKDVTVVYIEIEPGSGESVQKEFQKYWSDVKFVSIISPYRSIVGPFIDFLDETDNQRNDGQMAAVILTELIPAHWWQDILHNNTSLLLKAALLYRRRQLGFQRIIIDMPYHVKR